MNEDIQKKVKKIEIITKKVMDEMLTGGYKSHFRGQGVQFSEHRTYNHGDDIRHIDWKVSARNKEPLLKLYEEERELSVFIIADLSASLEFGSKKHLKKDVVAELGAVIAYAASMAGDRVGVLIVTQHVRKIIELKKGRNHVLRIIRDLLTFPTETGGTNLKEAFEEASHLMKHTGIVFVLSDFRAENYEKPIKQLARKHDVVAIQIEDPNEYRFEGMGTISVFDPESNSEISFNPNTYGFKKEFGKSKADFENKTRQILSHSGVEVLSVTTHEDYVDRLLRFFKKRKKKK